MVHLLDSLSLNQGHFDHPISNLKLVTLATFLLSIVVILTLSYMYICIWQVT